MTKMLYQSCVKKVSLMLIATSFCVSLCFAQKTAIYTNDQKLYIEGIDLFQKEKYSAALQNLETFLDEQIDPNADLSINAEYYAGICALYLYHKDAEYRLEKFVQSHPESPWVRKIYFELGNYNYMRKKYKKSLEWFDYVDPGDLKPEILTEFYFKRGHSYFEGGRYEKARQDFYHIKDEESRFQIPSIYYYSHIAYRNGKYQTALEGFEKIQDDPNFGPVVPYYVTQIYYNQGKYEELLSYAPTLLDSAHQKTTKRQPEIARLVGDAYYKEGQFEEAQEYLEFYHEEVSKKDRTRQDFYQLGTIYYRTGDYMSSLDAFNEVVEEEDSLAQSALYHMADCYLKLDQKNYARSAFKEVSEQDYIIELKEDALFHYAKLAFELSYNPFHEAITAFEEYLEEYPDSFRKDEAYEFLLSVYMKSKNYEKALASLDKIQNKDNRTKEAYQVVTFNRAVELYQTKQYEKAHEYFDLVKQYPVNPSLIAEALFWKAELFYSNKLYSKAVTTYTAFLQEPGGYQSEFYNQAHYGAGYSLFKQKKYTSSATSFRKYIDNHKGIDIKRLNDAYLRVGDCYYVSKEYQKAIGYYNEAIALDQPMKDYAMYQKGICYEYMKNEQQAISTFESLLDSQTGSKYIADAKFQLAKTYLQKEDRGKAKVYYLEILENHSTSPYVKYSMVDLCLIYVKEGNREEAKKLWTRIKTDYPNDQAAVDAYNLVEQILIEDEELEDLPPILGLTNNDIEEKMYRSALDVALEGDCYKAISKLEEYLKKYQPGIFATEAHYYLGNCYNKQNKPDQALVSFNFVASQPVGMYTEEALVASATINYNNENYEQALNNYIELESVAIPKSTVLEAEIGQMRCHYFLNQFSYAKEYADKVIKNDGTPRDILSTAYLWRGRILMEEGQGDTAYYDFLEAVKLGGENGAEAKFHMAEVAYNKGSYKAAETEIFQLIEDFSSYSEWKYNGFLLLADTYVGLEDLFQARATLNAILENVSEPWVVSAAQAKIQELDDLENSQNATDDVAPDEIDLSGEDQIDND